MSVHEKRIEAIRKAVGDYIHSEGCSCCELTEEHDAARKRLADLLEAKPDKTKYKGYDWGNE